MKIFNKSCAFASFFIVLCVIIEVRGTILDLNFTGSPDSFAYEKQADPSKISYIPRNIESSIEKNMKNSSVLVNLFEDVSDLNSELQNSTHYETEHTNNRTDENFFRLSNENLNATQHNKNFNHFRTLNSTSPDKLGLLFAKGRGRTIGDFYRDRRLFTNVSLRTNSQDLETLDQDMVSQIEKVQKDFSKTGEMKYEGRNESDSEVQEKSEYFHKSKNFVKDERTGFEKNLQDIHFNRLKNVNQSNSNRWNTEMEEFVKTKTQDYQKDHVNGDEMLQRKWLNHLRQENIYNDSKTQRKFLRNRKNRKSSFSNSPSSKKNLISFQNKLISVTPPFSQPQASKVLCVEESTEAFSSAPPEDFLFDFQIHEFESKMISEKNVSEDSDIFKNFNNITKDIDICADCSKNDPDCAVFCTTLDIQSNSRSYTFDTDPKNIKDFFEDEEYINEFITVSTQT